MLRARKCTRHPAICRTQLDCGRRARPNQALVQPIHTDAANQLTTISRSGTFTLSGNLPATAASIAVNGAAAQTNGDFTFAKTGLTLADGNNTFTVSAQNLLGVTTNSTLTLNFPATVTYQYDLNGNLLTDGIRTFQWDAADQLAQVSVPNAWQTQFARDGLGRLRILREFTWRNGAWSQTNETRYLYDGNLIVQERDANNNVLTRYTRGLDLSGGLSGAGGIGGLLSRTAGANSYYYHSDGAGNITAMLDGNENVVARYLYDSFGRVLGQWGALAGANPMQFSSMPRAPASGLNLYPFRAYDPALQRWLSRDPLGEAGGLSQYGFVGNNPLNGVDLDGRFILSLLFLANDLVQTGQDLYYGRSTVGDAIFLGIDVLALLADTATLGTGGDALELATVGGRALALERLANLTRAQEAAIAAIEAANAGAHAAGWVGANAEMLASHCSLGNGSGTKPPKQGGTYVLRDLETGEVVRSGRTGDLTRRRAEHARDEILSNYQFEITALTNVKAEQRGLEQLLHEQCNPVLNKINAVSPTNPNLHTYLDAANNFLKGGKQ